MSCRWLYSLWSLSLTAHLTNDNWYSHWLVPMLSLTYGSPVPHLPSLFSRHSKLALTNCQWFILFIQWSSPIQFFFLPHLKLKTSGISQWRIIDDCPSYIVVTRWVLSILSRKNGSLEVNSILLVSVDSLLRDKDSLYAGVTFSKFLILKLLIEWLFRSLLRNGEMFFHNIGNILFQENVDCIFLETSNWNQSLIISNFLKLWTQLYLFVRGLYCQYMLFTEH